MALLLLADSNAERIWLSVRNNRELLRSAIFVPVKCFDQMQAGFQAMLPSVSILVFLCYIVNVINSDRDIFNLTILIL